MCISSPQDEGTAYHSRVLRYDTRQDFKNIASWEVFDIGLTHSYQGAAFDGHYIYFCPGYEGTPDVSLTAEDKYSGSVVRLDTRGEFKDAASWKIFDVKSVTPNAACFDGGAFDGRYLYFVPLNNGVVVQYDTKGDFADPDSWRTYDIGPFIGSGWCVGAVFDGRYLYLVPYMHGVVVRCDTHGDFTADKSWESYDSNDTGGLDTSGADGGFFDGRYVYFIPWAGRLKGPQGSGHHANFLRYDTRGGLRRSPKLVGARRQRHRRPADHRVQWGRFRRSLYLHIAAVRRRAFPRSGVALRHSRVQRHVQPAL